MTGRRGLTGQTVVDAATAIVETEGTAALTLSRVARELGVKPPSLYNHVARLETLRRDVALRATEDLGTRLGAAAMGRSGRAAKAPRGRPRFGCVPRQSGLSSRPTRAP